MTHKPARYDFAVARKVARPLYSRDTREHHAGLSMRIDRGRISQTRRNLMARRIETYDSSTVCPALRYDYVPANVNAPM